jgi:hypothetical protein
MRKPTLFLALMAILFSTATIAGYKINISLQVLNEKSKFGEVSLSLPELLPFDETGEFGNIALIGSNGITESSITSNSTSSNNNYPFSAIFDGHQQNTQINSSSTGKIDNGYFHSSHGTSTNRYFSVDLGREASISGFRVLGYSQNSGNYNPKNIRIESSVDGTPGSFTLEESFTLPKVADSGVISMATPFNSRYFRFHVEESYGSEFLVFGEVEVFQIQL